MYCAVLGIYAGRQLWQRLCSHGDVLLLSQTHLFIISAYVHFTNTAVEPTCSTGQSRIANLTVNMSPGGGSGTISGRAEVCYNSTWWSVCDLNWDENDARVLCADFLGSQFGIERDSISELFWKYTTQPLSTWAYIQCTVHMLLNDASLNHTAYEFCTCTLPAHWPHGPWCIWHCTVQYILHSII